jgi:3-isopropylmalate/(R)-2-methylmalate dehydratase small subunit
MALGNLQGRVAWIFAESNFDVDQIVGIKNIKLTDIGELVRVAMAAYDPDFAKRVRPGDLLVGGENFGYGHPHYPPMKAMRHLGIAGVIAESFSPGYWRGEISMGFPLVPCPGIIRMAMRWDDLLVDWTRGVVCHQKTGNELSIGPLSVSDRRMLEAGGLIPFLKAALAEEAESVR